MDESEDVEAFIAENIKIRQTPRNELFIYLKKRKKLLWLADLRAII